MKRALGRGTFSSLFVDNYSVSSRRDSARLVNIAKVVNNCNQLSSSLHQLGTVDIGLEQAGVEPQDDYTVSLCLSFSFSSTVSPMLVVLVPAER